MVSSVPLKTNVFYWKSGHGCPQALPELSLVLIEYSREEERKNDQIHEGFFKHLDGMKAKIKGKEAGVAACQEQQIHRFLILNA